MEYNKLLADMVPGDRVEGFYILKEGAIKTSNSGKPFLSATVTDKSGSLDLKAWDYSGPVGAPTDAGKVVKIRADVTEYRGSIQLTASNIRMATQEDSYDVSALVPVAPIDRDETLEKVRSLIASMASLISFKYIAGKDSSLCRRYLAEFTLANLIFLAVLLLFYFYHS